MRVWDVHPGYLSRSRLLGQHVEIHAIWSVISNQRQGYSQHPETMRWRQNLNWLRQVHSLTAAEMSLRGFGHNSPIEGPEGPPQRLTYIDRPLEQFLLLQGKYKDKEAGRLPLPASAREFWRHHQAAVYARGRGQYRQTSPGAGKGPLTDAFLEQVLEVCRRPLDLPLAGEALGILAGSLDISLPGKSLLHQAIYVYDQAVEKQNRPVMQASLFSDILALGLWGG